MTGKRTEMRNGASKNSDSTWKVVPKVLLTQEEWKIGVEERVSFPKKDKNVRRSSTSHT